MKHSEEHDTYEVLGEAQRRVAEEEMFERVRRERESRKRDDAEDAMFEEARSKRMKEEQKRRKKLERDIARHVSPQPETSHLPEEAHVIADGASDAYEQRGGIQPSSGMGRREFIKKAGLGGAALIGAGGLWEGYQRMSRLFDRWNHEREQERLKRVEEEKREAFFRYVRETGNIISRDRETIVCVESIDALKEYWKDVYTGNKDKVGAGGRVLTYDIASAYEKMSVYDNLIAQFFRAEGVPADLRFLSIVESGWNEKNMGEKYNGDIAGGPFQFMGYTGQAYGLTIDRSRGIDERFDPLRSAHAAARYLKWMLQGNGNNPDFALHEYNGGFALRYRDGVLKRNLRIKEGKEKGVIQEPSYEEFLGIMEENIRARREEMLQSAEANSFEKDLKEGMEGGVLGDYKENIEYVAKVRAVIELVNDRMWRKEHKVAWNR